MKLYLIHCGFYDPDLGNGIYESHIGLFVAADSFEAAKARVREDPTFRKHQMHVDGMEEVQVVGGARVRLECDVSLGGRTITVSHRHRDL